MMYSGMMKDSFPGNKNIYPRNRHISLFFVEILPTCKKYFSKKNWITEGNIDGERVSQGFLSSNMAISIRNNGINHELVPGFHMKLCRRNSFWNIKPIKNKIQGDVAYMIIQYMKLDS